MLWLIGMMGSGKSTIGAEVAERLSIEFVDMDTLYEERWGSIASQWASVGESGFRDREARLVAEVATRPIAAVVATGGGTVTSATAVELMRTSGTVVWLKAATDTLAARLVEAPRRPILEKRSLQDIDRERHELYSGAAHHIVQTDDLSAGQVVEEVMAAWRR
ncbi:shikimate kinase 1 [bacterium BMS3Abin02]|nr:shikimate kinase 1 [bacterium BMS3Abin02]HDK45076.1 shikimate kinase [Actinomycetota bacterium]